MMSFENCHYRIFLHWEIMAGIIIVRKTLPKSKYILKKTKILYYNKTSKEEGPTHTISCLIKVSIRSLSKRKQKNKDHTVFRDDNSNVVAEGALFFWFMKLHWASSSTCPPEGCQMYNQRAKNTPSDWPRPTNPDVYSDLLHANSKFAHHTGIQIRSTDA